MALIAPANRTHPVLKYLFDVFPEGGTYPLSFFSFDLGIYVSYDEGVLGLIELNPETKTPWLNDQQTALKASIQENPGLWIFWGRIQ